MTDTTRASQSPKRPRSGIVSFKFFPRIYPPSRMTYQLKPTNFIPEVRMNSTMYSQSPTSALNASRDALLKETGTVGGSKLTLEEDSHSPTQSARSLVTQAWPVPPSHRVNSSSSTGMSNARSPTLPRSNDSLEMAYFLRNTGPSPGQHISSNKSETTVPRKKMLKESHLQALKLLGYGKRVVTDPDSGDVATASPPSGTIQKISKAGKRYLQITVGPEPLDDNLMLRRQNSTTFSHRTHTIETDNFDNWLSRFSWQQRAARPALNVFGPDVFPEKDEQNAQSGPPPLPLHVEEALAMKDWNMFVGPNNVGNGSEYSVKLQHSPPSSSMDALSGLDVNVSPRLPTTFDETAVYPPDLDPQKSPTKPAASESTTCYGGNVAIYADSQIGDAGSLELPTAAAEWGPFDCGNREEKIRARKLKDLRRHRKRFDDGTQFRRLTLEERIEEARNENRQTLHRPRTRGKEASMGIAFADDNASEPRDSQDLHDVSEEADSLESAQTAPVARHLNLSPVMLVSERPPVSRVVSRRSKRTAKSSKSSLANPNFPRPDGPPPSEPIPPVPPASMTDSPTDFKRESSRASSAPNNNREKLKFSKDPYGSHSSSTSATRHSGNNKKKHTSASSAPAAPSGGIATQQQQRTSICSSHTSVSRGARLEARVEALERENTLLEAALIAVLKTAGTMNGCTCGGSGAGAALGSHRAASGGLGLKRMRPGKEDAAKGVVPEEEGGKDNVAEEAEEARQSPLDVFLETRSVV